MTTSGTYSFSVTRDDIIRQSMLNIKRLDPEESPSSVETDDCTRVLNMMCKQWMGKSDFAPGLKIWTRKRGHLLLQRALGPFALSSSGTGWTNDLTRTTLASAAAAAAGSIVVTSASGFGTGSVVYVVLDSGAVSVESVASVASTTITLVGTLDAAAAAGNTVFVYTTAAQAPLTVESAVLRDVNDRDVPLFLFTDVKAYDAYPGKLSSTDLGDPNSILVESGINSASVWLDVGYPNDCTKHIVLTYQEPVQDFINPTDTPHYPQEWFLALCWGLSEQISPMFNSKWTEKMEALKVSAMAIARNKGSENSSLYFQPGLE